MNIDILDNNQLALMDQLISHANTVLVVCHKSPDGDAIGSSLAWAELLRQRGKDVTVVVPDQYPDFLKWLPNTEKIVATTSIVKSPKCSLRLPAWCSVSTSIRPVV